MGKINLTHKKNENWNQFKRIKLFLFCSNQLFLNKKIYKIQI